MQEIAKAAAFARFGADLAAVLARDEPGLRRDPREAARLLAHRPDGDWAGFDLTPFVSVPGRAGAHDWFAGVRTRGAFFAAYGEARAAARLEQLEGGAHVHPFAQRFLEALMDRARAELNDAEAARIAAWLSHLDLYAAVKGAESLLASRADRLLLELAPQRGWFVHFDHLAIRCGPAGDAERVARGLIEKHGYVRATVPGEERYVFEDGWNAYPLYKILDNGQVLRLFLDESAANVPAQIIQHWNRVYGYTAHHLALRATRWVSGRREAVPLAELHAALAEQGVETLEPAGGYAYGLLEQVFTRPARAEDVPVDVRAELAQLDPALADAIGNAKLIELVSRREMPPAFVADYFRLYGLKAKPGNPLYSAPAYGYFLPAQAAHVIRTSVGAAA